VREFGPQAGRHTQLSFAGDLALHLTTKAGVLGFTPHNQSGPTVRERARRRATALDRPPSLHLVDPDQHLLFTLNRDWSEIRALNAAELPALTDHAAALLAEFNAAAPATAGGTALLRALLAWLGAQAPIAERDVRSLAEHAAAPSTRRVLGFLQQRGLLQPDDPHHDLQASRQHPPQTDQQRPRRIDLTGPDTERHNRHLQRATSDRSGACPDSAEIRDPAGLLSATLDDDE
jgi:hypothetical protein